MNLAYLTSEYGRASDTFVRGEIRELRAQGHVVHVFSIRRPGAEHLIDTEVEQEQASTIYLLGKGVLALLWAFVHILLTRPARLLRAACAACTIGPQGMRARAVQFAYLMEASLLATELMSSGVQHLHDHIGENSGTVALLASILTDIPFSMTLHGPSIFYAPQRWGLGLKIEACSFTACVSDFCRGQCMAFSPPASWKKLRVVHCGLNDEFLLSPPVSVPEVPRLICVGRLCAEKGHLILVEAAAKLLASGLQFELVLVGDGPLRSQIEDAIRKSGAQSAIKLAGWQNSAEVRGLIQSARAMVLPSFAEGLPVVFMEALALGRPVIATCIAGIPELVEGGKSGWLVPAGSTEALANAMREALTMPAEALQSMGMHGRHKVLQDHDLRSEVGKLARAFQESIRNAEGIRAAHMQPQAVPSPAEFGNQ